VYHLTFHAAHNVLITLLGVEIRWFRLPIVY